MTTRSENFAGLSVAVVTPFRGGKVDFDAMGKQVEFQIAAGTTAIVPVGTTGESPTLSFDEHEQVISAMVEAAAGKIKVMAGTGANSTDEAIHLTQFAERAGCDAALVVAPYYNKPMAEGFFQHFKAVAQSTSLPICIYNIPGRTAKNMEPETIVRIADACTNVTMVKESTGSMDQTSAILARSNLTVLSGDDSITLPLMSLGARGVVSVVGNIVPHDVIALCRAIEQNDFAQARALHYKLFPLCRDMLSLATNPIPVKAAMKLLGRDSGELRLPMTSLPEADIARLKQTLINYGILD